jgi:putative transposase
MWNARCGFSGSQILGEDCFVSTLGRNGEMIRAYIRNQEMADEQLDQQQLKLSSS